jgi:Holliday junction resolvasome RuvABC endonuclease subunit
MTRILALDLSLTSTGAAHEGGTCRITSKKRGTERLIEIREAIRSLALSVAPDLVVVEGYSMGSRGRVFDIGELGGIVKVLLADMGIPVAIVPPSCLKKFATGKGNADKDSMLEAAIRNFGFGGHGNDEADAWLLYCMAATRDGSLNAKQREAVAAVEWPL